MDVTTLRMKKEYKSSIEFASKWYSVLNELNSFNWKAIECNILGFSAMKGDISSGGKKEEFCKLYNISVGTLNNSISVLYKRGFLIKEEGKTKIHKDLYLNVNTDILLQLKMLHV